MADEEILETGEVAEPSIDKEEMEGFDNYQSGTADEGGEKKTDKDESEDKKGESEAEDKSGSEAEEGDDKKKDGKGNEEEDDKKKGGEEEEETAEQKALKRAEKYKDKEDTEKDKDKGGKPKEGEDDDKDKGGKKAPSITKEQVKTYLDVIQDDDLPGEIIIGDDTIDIKGLKENYPDDYNAIKVMTGIMADKIVKQRIEEGEFIRASDINEFAEKKIAPLEEKIERLSFWDAVRDAYPDAKTIARSDEFNEWVSEQPKHVQRLGSSWDAEDAVSLIGAYLESKAKKKAADHDDKQRDEKKKKDGLLGNSMRSKASSQKTETKNDMEDEEAGFNEGLAQLGK